MKFRVKYTYKDKYTPVFNAIVDAKNYSRAKSLVKQYLSELDKGGEETRKIVSLKSEDEIVFTVAEKEEALVKEDRLIV